MKYQKRISELEAKVEQVRGRRGGIRERRRKEGRKEGRKKGRKEDVSVMCGVCQWL